MFSGQSAITRNIELPEADEYNPQSYMKTINLQICQGTPRWGQRANHLLFTHLYDAIILMLPEDAFFNNKDSYEDWLI